MENIWYKSYPPGIPKQIGELDEHTLCELFINACQKFSHLTALESFGATLTYQQWGELSQHFAAYLQQKLGFKKGDSFAIIMPNCLQYPIALFGALLAGLKIVNVNPLYTPDEMVFQLNDSETKGLIVLANFAHTVQKALPQTQVKHVLVTELGDCFSTLKRMVFNFVVKRIKKMVPAYDLPQAITYRQAQAVGAGCEFKPVTMSGDDIAFLQYTGGTTGVPKGAVLLHKNMMSNLEQVMLWIKDGLKEGREVLITALPLYHIFSLTANGLVFLKIGGHNILITNPRDIPHFVATLRKVKFSVITGVNTLFNALMNHPDFAKCDFSNLRLALSGGMATQAVVARRWREITGHTLVEAYGLTEACPAVTINPLTLADFNHSIGLPLPSTEVSVRNSEDQEVPQGEIGELWIRGPQIMASYWKKPEETRKVLSADGWLRTGDIVRLDENGYVYVVDRLKDMVVVSGFNVYPNEVEGIIASHPGVLEVGVIGLPNPKTGEEVNAFIVKRDNALTEDSILSFCREHLAAYKIPKHIEFIDELPKTNVGKILRRALRDKTSDTA